MAILTTISKYLICATVSMPSIGSASPSENPNPSSKPLKICGLKRH